MTDKTVDHMAAALRLKGLSNNQYRQVGAMITNGVGAHNTYLMGKEVAETTQHAEARAICHSAAEGIATRGHEIYVTLSPCVACAKLIIQAGIKAVHFHDFDADQGLGLLMLEKSGVKLIGPLAGK